MRIVTIVDPSFFPYWDRNLEINEIYPEYQPIDNGNELFVITANSIEIIGLFYALDIDAEYDETPGRLIPFNLELIDPLELQFLYQDNFGKDHISFSEEVLEYMKLTATDRYNQLIIRPNHITS